MTFVAGYMQSCETEKSVAKREVEEEIGLQVLSLDYAGSCWFARKQLLMRGFIASVNKDNFTLSSEVDSAF